MVTSEQVAGVRRFNRIVTQRAGVLEDRLLGEDRPLGQSRLLYEVGRQGPSLRDLRLRLGLDSGYLSRLIRGLASRGLVAIAPDEGDPRVRWAALTEKGLRAFEEINARSDGIATELLGALDERQRDRLVQAMHTVVRLLRIAELRLEVVDPSGPESIWCLEQCFRELEERFDEGFSAEESLVSDPGVFRLPGGAFLLGTVDGRPVACGALKFIADGEGRIHKGYIKRMWVDGGMRGTGMGRRLLSALKELAAEHGCTSVQLETNRVLDEAQALYRSAGYREVEPFNDEVYAHHWFEKALQPSADS